MNVTDCWERVQRVFQAAIDLPPDGRDTFLITECGDQEDVRREVASLLAAHDAAGAFLETPALRPASDRPSGTLLSLRPAERVGHFVVLAPLGAGGMGEVYRAHDTRLGRDVAIKLLPPALAADPQRLARFERESRVLASLNHPNIASLYDIERSGQLQVLVLELVEGPTLGERLEQGPLPFATALSIAAQLARALEAAHQRAIVHRDLKPANVKLASGGTVKLLDFGLAKERVSLAARGSSLHTEPGVILGTWAYMSPEQALGRPVDQRADIWAFGCILFELLAGRRAFGGDTPAATLAAVLDRQPEWSQLSPRVPAPIRDLLASCLEKVPHRRLPAIGEAVRTLEECGQRSVHGDRPRTFAWGSIRRVAVALGIIIMGTIPWGGGGRWSDRPTAYEPSSTSAEVGRTVGPAYSSIAVLPFDHASSSGPGLEFLSHGLSEAILDRLSELPGMKVIARSSSFRYRSSDVDVRAAGAALGAEALVMGRVARRGDELVVRTELVDTRWGTQVWSEQYRRSLADLQTVQDEIVQTIVDRLRLRLTQSRGDRHGTTTTSQAYLLYLTGLYHLRTGTREDALQAIHLAEQAVAMDDTFARAWLLIAQAYFGLSGNSLTDPALALPRARAAARRALALDETLAEAHLSMAMLEQDDWKWPEAERRFISAIALNPNLASAHGQYGRFLSVLGRIEEALASVRRAQALDPLQPGWRRREGVILYLGRRYSEAVERLEHAVALEPRRPVPLYYLGFAYEAAGRHEAAITMLKEAIALEPTFTSARVALGFTLASAGRPGEARAELESLRRGSDYVSPTELATVHSSLGDRVRALHLLEEAYAAHDLQLQYLNVVPQFDRLRSEPRFVEIVRRVGLPQ